MGSNSNVNLSHLTSNELLADKVGNCFMKKTTIIRNKTISHALNNPFNISMDPDIMFNGKMPELFRSASEVEIKEIITKSLNKSCDLDPLSIWLLKKCINQLPPLITAFIDRSADELMIPLCLKRAASEIWVG